ncbi:MAG: DsrE/DsrF/DrsH-like family protein [Nitrososphaerota archaeon]|nr:DsrE/DsrF/DrsH-like family protein [Nitrososphaerota archaeon]
MSDKMALVLFSGTVDRLLPVGIIASGAVAMGMDVHIFATFWGLNAFRKDAVNTNTSFSKDYENMKSVMMELMQKKNVPSWYSTLKTAKELGNVKIHACAMTYDLMGFKKEDLADIVDDVIAVGEFVEMAKEAKTTLFI